MRKYVFVIAAACTVGSLPAVAADANAKTMMKSADDTYRMSKKQAKADEKSALAQCGTLSGDVKSQCKKEAEAAYKKTMADADASHDKSKADYKAIK